MDIHSASDRDIVRAINSDSIDAEDLVSREGWQKVCRARGRYFGEVDEEAWQSLCARHGYLLARRNPGGFSEKSASRNSGLALPVRTAVPGEREPEDADAHGCLRCTTKAVRYNFCVAGPRFIGVDLAWREGSADVVANETGVAVVGSDGRILDAGWTRGVEQTISWADTAAGDSDAVLFADAPLVVGNESGQRLCETQVGQRYGRWKVSANTTNIHSPRLAGVRFLHLAELSGWQYSDGSSGPPRTGRHISENYPYATLVGAAELGYDTERPRYKRKPPRLPAVQWRPARAATCDTLIERLTQLAEADPPILLYSHPVTRELAEQPSPLSDVAYKHREDLIDALLCAWTASLWAHHGFDRCQVLGLPAKPASDPAATMIVPARPEQRLQPLPESALPAADEDALPEPSIAETFPRKRFVKRCTSRFRGTARS